MSWLETSFVEQRERFIADERLGESISFFVEM